MAESAESDATITRCASHMADPGMRKLLQDQAMRDFYGPRRAPLTLPAGDLNAYRNVVFQTIKNVPLTYLEFGVASGKSMLAMTERFKHPDSQFFGFDSFEGLPEDWSPLPTVSMKGGHFSRKGKLPAVDDRRVELVKGWFQNTLPPFLATGRVGGPRTHLVHYDADLYSSTLFILTTLWHHLPEYYFMMDEFPYDEVVALRDFVHSFPVEIKFLAHAGDKAFGRMRRVSFSLAT